MAVRHVRWIINCQVDPMNKKIIVGSSFRVIKLQPAGLNNHTSIYSFVKCLHCCFLCVYALSHNLEGNILVAGTIYNLPETGIRHHRNMILFIC